MSKSTVASLVHVKLQKDASDIGGGRDESFAPSENPIPESETTFVGPYSLNHCKEIGDEFAPP
jgi:hypothetical protein